MSYFQAIIIALLQGVTEPFPVSSLGHSVLVPAWVGGSWQTLVTQSSQQNSASSFYLAFIVALHVGTALALVWFFREDWVRIVRAFFRSARRSIVIKRFSASGSNERLAWLIVFATIPVGLTGVLLEHVFRTLFAKPLAAGIFLTINGLILYAGERTRRAARTPSSSRAAKQMPIAGGADDVEQTVPGGPAQQAALPSRGPRSAQDVAEAYAADMRISRISYGAGTFIGCMQILALLAGISRSGVTMVGGLWRGLHREDAARFAFLLATPVILAAGVLKLPDLAGHAGAHIRGQALVGFLLAGAASYVSVRFLMRYFRTSTLVPFAVYCVLFGVASIARFA